MNKIIIYSQIFCAIGTLPSAVATSFHDLPDDILIREILPCLRAIDFFRLDQVSKQFHRILKNDRAWKPIVDRHTPSPITEWLVGQYHHATKRMLNNISYVEFPKTACGKVFDFMGAINWDGSVFGGSVITSVATRARTACIYTEERGMEILQNLARGRNSRVHAINHDGSVVGGCIMFGKWNNDKAFIWNQHSGMQAIWSTDDDIKNSVDCMDWSGLVLL